MRSHAPVDRIGGEGERNPGFDQTVRIGHVRVEVDGGGETFRQLGRNDKAEGTRRLERIDHVKVVRPGLCKILPGVRCRVRGHEVLRPVGGRAGRIIVLQRDRIVLALVAENLPEFLQM